MFAKCILWDKLQYNSIIIVFHTDIAHFMYVMHS